MLGLLLFFANGAVDAANVNVTVGPSGTDTFAPANVTVNAGDTVTFSYSGGAMPHNVVSDGLFRCAKGCDGAGGNGNATGSSWNAQVTFNTPGAFNYYCEIHGTPTAGMHGKITVNGSAPPSPDFGVGADSGTANILQGGNAAVGITVTPQNGFSGNVAYAASGLPAGVTASFANDSATHATMTLTASGTAAVGTSNVTITATSGSLVHTTSVALTVTASTPTFSIARGITGSWYNPAQSGQGFNVEVLPNNTFVAFWYVFDDTGHNLWLTGAGAYSGDSVTLNMTATTGGAFPPAFDPTKIARNPWGTLTLTFSDCNNATASWTSNDTTQVHFPNGSMPVKRLTSVDTLTCP
jgi:plastocyanin